MYLITSAADFSKETLVVKEDETYDAGAFEKVEAEVVKLLKEPKSLVELEYWNGLSLRVLHILAHTIPLFLPWLLSTPKPYRYRNFGYIYDKR